MKLGVTLDILNQKATPAFYADTLANRPAAGFTGRVFISTDTYDLYRDTGTAWVLLSPANTGTITGGGSLYRVGIWTSTTNLGESNNLVFDYSTNRLGINTNAPTASLDVHGTTNVIAQLNQLTTGQNALLTFQDNSVGKWRLGNIYNAAANDFGIVDILNSLQRFTIKNTGQTFVGTETTSSGLLVVNSSTADNQIVAIGANAPSIRVRNAGTSPTQQFGLGLATATNNFIQGSASGDFCLFNGSTTASPILFGVYDAGAGNVQEAARISAARNFLIGTTTDAGQKLQVVGTSRFTSDMLVNGFTLGRGGGNAGSNTAFGLSSLNANTSGIGNTAIGNNTLQNNTTGTSNIAVGSDSLSANTIGDSNVAIGRGVLQLNTSGNNNNAVGRNSLNANISGIENSAFGTSALASSTGNNNSAFGFAALTSTTSGANEAFGSNALRLQTTGNFNAGFGNSVMRANTTGSRNTGLGFEAGRYIANKLTEATIVNNSIFIGWRTSPLADNQTNQIVIGYDAIGLGSNTTTIGNNSTLFTALYGNLLIGTTINGSSKLRIVGLPTSAAGLSSGDVYSNLGVLTIVP